MQQQSISTTRKIQACIIINLGILLGVAAIICRYAEIKYGYSSDLVIIGMTIDTPHKYFLLHLIIFIVEFTHSLIYEYANPILYFNIFNDERQTITDFGKFELQFYAQSMWFLTSIKNGFMLLVSISQLDIILAKIIYNEIAVVLVIRNKLNNKQFNTELHQVLVE